MRARHDTEHTLNESLAEVLDNRPADPIAFLLSVFNRATAETGSVECAAEYLRRAHANTLVVRTKCSLAAREPRKSLDMYYAAFALIADGEDGSALEPNAFPTSASGAQCATLLQCLCAALAFPPQVFQILRAELFLESTVRVTFEEFVAVMDVCLAVIDVDTAAEDALCALHAAPLSARVATAPLHGTTLVELLQTTAACRDVDRREGDGGGDGGSAIDRLSAAFDGAVKSSASAAALANDFAADDGAAACAELDLLLIALVHAAQ